MFVGTVENKLDRKGRVSVPAAYRAHLIDEGFPGFYAFPSPRLDTGAIEACGIGVMRELNERVGRLDLFSEQQDDLTALVFASAHQLGWDGEGRVILPAELIEHAGVSDRVVFVGRGRRFQLWEPEKYSVVRRQVEARVRLQPPTLQMGSAAGQEGAR